MKLFTRILTDRERQRMRAFLKEDGERTGPMRTIVWRSRMVLPEIEKDITLMKEVLKHYSEKGRK
jgi:predicted lipoprotein